MVDELINNEPLVSVLMTSYNREKYIGAAIESVLLSTYKNFELIICDDDSSDKTVEKARTYLKDNRVKIYKNQKNLGQFANRNKAAFYAKGKYLKYVDSDDIMYEHSLKLMVNIMESFPDCGLGFSHTIGNSKWVLPHKYAPKEIYVEHYFGGGILFSGPIGTIIKRDAFNTVGGFDFFGMPSDNHFSLKIAARFPVVSMYRDLIWWRNHDDQEFKGETDEINILNNLQWNENILLSQYCPLEEADQLKARRNFNKIFLLNIFKTMIYKPFKFPKIYKMMQGSNINLLKIFGGIIKIN